MSDTMAVPVKGMVNAFHRGTVLTKRICKIAGNGSSALTLDTQQSAQALQKSLERSEGRLRDANAKSIRTFGRQFAAAVVDDVAITNRLQALTINVQDQIMSLDEYMDDPDAFDLGSFGYIVRECERCCDQAIYTLGLIHNSMLRTHIARICPPPRADCPPDDRSTLSSQRQGLSLATTDSAGSSIAEERHTDLGTTTSTSSGAPQIPEKSVSRGAKAMDSVMDKTPSPGHGPRPAPPVNVWQLTNLALPGEQPSLSIYDPTAVRNSVASAVIPPLSLTHEKAPLVLSSNEAFADSTTDDRGALDQTRLGDGVLVLLISSKEVNRQVDMNEQLLEKRRQSRLSFQQDMVSLRGSFLSSSSNLSPMSPLASLIATSPELKAMTGVSPKSVPQLRQESFLTIGLKARDAESCSYLKDTSTSTETSADSSPSSFPLFSPDSVGRNSTATTSSAYSAASPLLAYATPHEEFPKAGSAPPTPPPRNQGRPSRIDDFGALSRTLRTPDFGSGVEDGIQVIAVHDAGLVPAGNGLVSDPGLMLADESAQTIGPTFSVTHDESTAISHEASFYKHGGFCNGAKRLRDGNLGVLKVIKKPSAGVGFNALVSMRCVDCPYEIGWDTYENDKALDRAGIFNIVGGGGIRFRQRFLSKSHLQIKYMDKPVYACIFCIEDGKTVDSHDATVFFSVTRLLQHIQKHSRPLRSVDGVQVLYGDDAEAVDFDLCFKDMEPKPDPLRDYKAKFSSRPRASAIVTHREREKGYKEKDPDGNKTLEFAIGASIVGITYPPRFNGQWCCGYHDGEKAFFPASTIQLRQPLKENVPMSPRSSLIAVARWEHKPKDSNGGWLAFKPKEKITNIGFTYEDFWCWTGVNSKGKYGIFPATFVEGLVNISGEKKIDLKDVGTKAINTINAGTEERWSGNVGTGIWVGIGGPVHSANAPRPVRKSKKNKSEELTTQSNSSSLTMPSRMESVGGSSFFGRKSFGRRSTNASRSSDGSSTHRSPI